MPAKKNIKTVDDVLRYFGACFKPKDTITQKNASLSHRIYKDTDCGAWGALAQEACLRKETWRARYTRTKKGGWHVKDLCLVKRGGEEIKKPKWIALGKAPESVREYFWPSYFEDAAHAHEELSRIFKTKTTIQSEEAEINVPFRKRWVFRCGSIVEGTDAEVQSAGVHLPCTEHDLDVAMKYVEDEAAFLWYSTHGCRGCVKTFNKEGRKAARERGYDFEPYVYTAGATCVHKKCPECKGYGEIV